ncbi:MAG: hypothetical protein ACXAEJ_00645, partial [Candidatus Thorarchaeota archaeon]
QFGIPDIWAFGICQRAELEHWMSILTAVSISIMGLVVRETLHLYQPGFLERLVLARTSIILTDTMILLTAGIVRFGTSTDIK